MSTIVKAGDVPTARVRLRKFDLMDHVEEARAIAERARNEAKALLQSAHEQARDVLRSAQEDGYRQGFASGNEAGRSEGLKEALRQAGERFDASHASVLTALESLVVEISERKEDLLIRSKRDLIELALAIAEKITMHIGALNRETVLTHIHNAIETVGAASDLYIKVNPKDRETLEEFAATKVKEMTSLGHIHLESDLSIAPGGCIVASPLTEIDAQLRTQFTQIAELLLGGSSSFKDPDAEGQGR